MTEPNEVIKELTINELISELGQHQWIAIAALIGFSVVTAAIAYACKKNNKLNWAANFLSPPIFIVTLPGVLFTLLLLYMLFISQQNLLMVPLIVLLVPVWFGLTLLLYSRIVNFDLIPGFDKISGLIIFCGITFLGILLLLKLRIVVMTFLTPVYAAGIVMSLYTLWRKGLSKMIGAQPKEK